MTIDDLLAIMRSSTTTPASVRLLSDDVAKPLRARLNLSPVGTDPPRKGCPCQFLFRQLFELPKNLRPNISTMISGAWNRGPARHECYLGLTISHECFEQKPGIRWGFAMEPGSTWKKMYRKGEDQVFLGIQKDLNLDSPFCEKVPNIDNWCIGFVGRRFTADELSKKGFTSVDALLDAAAADLRALSDRLAP